MTWVDTEIELARWSTNGRMTKDPQERVNLENALDIEEGSGSEEWEDRDC